MFSIPYLSLFVNTFFEKRLAWGEFCTKYPNSHKIHSHTEKFRAALD
jgi:hypothetical protein